MDTSDKDAYTEATQANDLRKALTQAAKSAAKYSGVDRDWVNTRLVQLGADPITSRSEYRVSVAITGDYGRRISAHTRAEALELFQQELSRVLAAGKINIYSDQYDNVYHVKTTAEPVFFSGPADAPEANDSIPGLAGLKDGIRNMLKEGVTEQGWGYQDAQAFLENAGLEKLPARVNHTVTVPVSGTTKVAVQVFEGDDVVALAAAVAAKLGKSSDWVVTAEEMGEPQFDEKPEVEDDDDPDDDEVY
jgi:hypothetical protein